jgi:hypothetical protein
MSYRNASPWFAVTLSCLALLVAGVGCNKDGGGPIADDQAHDGDDTDSIEESLAKLSDEDKALAESQKICPVGGEELGSMGVPVKVNVEGRDVLVCCESCEKPLREDPEKYFAILDQQ